MHVLDTNAVSALMKGPQQLSNGWWSWRRFSVLAQVRAHALRDRLSSAGGRLDDRLNKHQD